MLDGFISYHSFVLSPVFAGAVIYFSTLDYTSNRGLQLTQIILVHWSSPYKSRFTFVQSLTCPLEFTLKFTRFLSYVCIGHEYYLCIGLYRFLLVNLNGSITKN